MIEISNAAAPLLIQALQDAVRYNEQLLNSETLRDRADYEEHLLEVSQFYAEIKAQYKRIEDEVGIPLEELL
ncbi:hypothetical protein BTA51_23145 [Hahella sp. CCB-MM4]|uniref:hypothetical protein n=1 Tax=Hahella sp. (strain CCB-MM4) TaxID=1926491 RepID=UPI000B9A3ADA|nr:hypothetical protein [Hahella sp. CCB-MM4]OZG71004.1 hypothetical protein BTA51_23145 [Hahella sp. CCB-MM4]